MDLEEILAVVKKQGINTHTFLNKVQEKYAMHASNCDIAHLDALSKIIGIKPNLSEAVVQEGYAWLVKYHYVHAEDVDRIKAMQELTGIKPNLSEAVVQEGYANCIDTKEEHWLNNFKALQELTGIKPSNNVIQKGYALHLSVRRLDRFKMLQEATGIKPSKNVIQKGYVQYLYLGAVDDIKALQKLTGIKPNLSEAVVQDVYLQHTLSGYSSLTHLKPLQEFTGIKPNLPKELIQELYAKYVGVGRLILFQRLREFTGIEPSSKVIPKEKDYETTYYGKRRGLNRRELNWLKHAQIGLGRNREELPVVQGLIKFVLE